MDTPNVARLYHEVIGCAVSDHEMRAARAVDWYHTLSTTVGQAAS